ncbi:hypothetical protein AKO1_001578 [Acrasis kona]|uniref:Uncharacterized protein n=1 Tax=Acrasis kona TaxID=1008807 RepID=A0AAW2ZA75_9EUKA
MRVYCQMEKDVYTGGFIRIAHQTGLNVTLKVESAIFADVGYDFNRETLAFDDQLSKKSQSFMNLNRFADVDNFDIMTDKNGEVTFKTFASTTPRNEVQKMKFSITDTVTLYLRAH